MKIAEVHALVVPGADGKLRIPVCDRCMWFFPHCDDTDYDCLCGRDVTTMLTNKGELDALVKKGVIDEGTLEVSKDIVNPEEVKLTPCPDFEIAHFMLVHGFPYTPRQVFVLRDIERTAKRLAGEEEVD